MILENYINTHDVHLSPFLDKVGFSKKQISTLKVIEYPDALIRLISQAIGKNESTVWYELLSLENAENVTEITKIEELVEAVDARQAYLYIPEPIRQEHIALIRSVLTEKDRLGFELGSQGTGNILAEIIYQIGRVFGEGTPEFKRLKSKLRHYYVKVHDGNGSILYEKEQTY